MGTRDLEMETADIVAIIVDLYQEKKLGTEFSDYIKFILWLKEDWTNKNQTCVPEQFGIIRTLATEEDAKLLIDYLQQMQRLQKDIKLKDALQNVMCSSKCGSKKTSSSIKAAQVLAFYLIDDGLFNDIADRETCKDLVHFTLLQEKLSLAKTNDQSKLEGKLLSLYNAGRLEDLENYLRSFIMSVFELENKDESTIKFDNDIHIVIRIITEHILESQEYEEPEACLIDLIALLSLQEIRWRKKTSAVLGTGENRLPSDHQTILFFGKTNKNNALLHQFLQKLIKESRNVNAMQQVNDFLMMKGESIETTSVLNKASISSEISSTLTAGLSLLYLISSSTFKPLIAQLYISLRNPQNITELGVDGLPGVLIAGICIWNSFCLYKEIRSGDEDRQSVLDFILPMAVTSLLGSSLLITFVPSIAQIWLSFVIFGGTGLGMGSLTTPKTSDFSRWLLHFTPKDQAIVQAYELLNIAPTATDKELKTVYYYLARIYCNDMHDGEGVTQQLMYEATLDFLKIQRAFEFILFTRYAMTKQWDENSVLDRARKFFANVCSS